MSKELTTINILENEFEDYIHLDGFHIVSITTAMEQYAKAKVLEVLEEEKNGFLNG